MTSGQPNTRTAIPRYSVQCTGAHGPRIPADNGGVRLGRRGVERNAEGRMTWVKSFDSNDKPRTFRISTRRIPRRSGDLARNKLPVDRINRRLLDPYYYV